MNYSDRHCISYIRVTKMNRLFLRYGLRQAIKREGCRRSDGWRGCGMKITEGSISFAPRTHRTKKHGGYSLVLPVEHQPSKRIANGYFKANLESQTLNQTIKRVPKNRPRLDDLKRLLRSQSTHTGRPSPYLNCWRYPFNRPSDKKRSL